MGNRIGTGTALMLLGFLIAVTPQFIFPVCHDEHGHGMVMRCFWTARAELGAGLLIAGGGALLFCIESRAARFGISLMVLFAAILALAIPLYLIGVCDGPMMPCRAGTLPAEIVLGGLTAAAALLNAVYLRKPLTG